MTDTVEHNERDDRERAEGASLDDSERAEGASLDDSELVQAVADLRRAGTRECLDIAEALERVRGLGPHIMPWYRDDVRHALSASKTHRYASNARQAKRSRP